jgi:hypothetical protein
VGREVSRDVQCLVCGPGAVEADADHAHAHIVGIAAERSPAKAAICGAAEAWRGNCNRARCLSQESLDRCTWQDSPKRTAMCGPKHDEVGLIGSRQLCQASTVFGGSGGDDHLGTVGPGKNLTQLERVTPPLGLLVANENPAIHLLS